jgi:hypothetical protein
VAILEEISAFRVYVQKFIPSDFARKPREAKYLNRWKAAELRLDLLYLCSVIYKKFLSKTRYHHIMLLYVAIRLLLEIDSCKEDSGYADKLLRLFIKASSKLFGPQFVSFNIQGLYCHLAEGVRKHGSLEETSAFPFENKILIIKNSVHQGGKDLEQAVRRSDEKDAINLLKLKSRKTNNEKNAVFLVGNHTNGLTLPAVGNAKQYNKLIFGNSVLSNCLRDSVIIQDKTLQYFLIENFVDIAGVPYVIGKRYLTVESMFEYPLSSTNLFEAVVSCLSELELYPFNVIRYKCIRIPTSFPEIGTFLSLVC